MKSKKLYFAGIMVLFICLSFPVIALDTTNSINDNITAVLAKQAVSAKGNLKIASFAYHPGLIVAGNTAGITYLQIESQERNLYYKPVNLKNMKLPVSPILLAHNVVDASIIRNNNNLVIVFSDRDNNLHSLIAKIDEHNSLLSPKFFPADTLNITGSNPLLLSSGNQIIMAYNIESAQSSYLRYNIGTIVHDQINWQRDNGEYLKAIDDPAATILNNKLVFIYREAMKGDLYYMLAVPKQEKDQVSLNWINESGIKFDENGFSPVITVVNGTLLEVDRSLGSSDLNYRIGKLTRAGTIHWEDKAIAKADYPLTEMVVAPWQNKLVTVFRGAGIDNSALFIRFDNMSEK